MRVKKFERNNSCEVIMYYEIEVVVEVGGVDDNKRMEEMIVEWKK